MQRIRLQSFPTLTTQRDICKIMSTPTPRTDANISEHYDEMCDESFRYVNVGFARKLERELNALKASTSESAETAETKLPEDFRRIALLFTSRCTRTKMTKGEKTAWAGVKIKEHELVELEWFYGLDKSPEFDATWRRVGMPATLLNNLDNQLDLAFEMKEGLRKSQPKLGTPTQW